MNKIKLNNKLRLIPITIYRMIYSSGTVAAVLLTAAMCFLSKLPASIYNSDPSVIEGIISMLNGQKFEEIDYSSFAVFTFYDNSFWFPVVLPLLAGIVSINVISDDRTSGFLRSLLLRSDKRSYPILTTLSAGIASAAAVLCGIMLYGAIVGAIFPKITNCSSETYSVAVSRFDYFGNILLSGTRLNIIFIKLLNLFLVSMGWGCFGCLLSYVISNKFLSLCSMLTIGYISAKIFTIIQVTPMFTDASSVSDPVYYLYLLIPYFHNDMYSIFRIRYGQPFIYYVLFSFVIYALICYLAVILFGRRTKIIE